MRLVSLRATERVTLRSILIVPVAAFFLFLAAATTAADAPAPPLVDTCGSAFSGLAAESMWLTTRDGVRLYAVEAGSGSTTIVLAHEAVSSLCESLPYAKTLIDSGLRVLAFDFRGYGNSDRPRRNHLALGTDLAAAVERARSGGAGPVFLLGASMGGAAIVQNTSNLAVDGRISLSGTRLWRGFGVNDPAGVRRLRSPFLYVGSRRDRIVPVREALQIFRRVGSRDKRTAFYRGSRHGYDLVQSGPYAARVRAQILAWVRSRAT
jgi:alpha-beta hydrolase superfamily lysophospholipase